MKHGFCSATTFSGSTALPFVISTGAQRSGEISVWMLSLGNIFLQSEALRRGLRFSAAWGVFNWREFATAPARAKTLLFWLFVLFLSGLSAVALAPLF
jgi:hypothetical protein